MGVYMEVARTSSNLRRQARPFSQRGPLSPNQLSPNQRLAKSGASTLQSVSSGPLNIGTLVRDAEDIVSESERLRAEIFKQQQQSRQRRYEFDLEVSDAIRADTERLMREKEVLETELAEELRDLHTLESTCMDHNHVARHQRQHARTVANQLRRLREGDVTDNDAAIVEGEGVKCLKDMHRVLDAQRQGIDDEIQRAYVQKERTETHIVERRHAASINEA